MSSVPTKIIPSLNEIVELSKVIDDQDIANRPRQELLELAQKLMEDHPFIVSTDPRPPVHFWRARVSPTASGFNLVQDMIQPPVERCTAFNRCGGPGQSIFYATTSAHTAFSEVGATAGDYVQAVIVTPKDNCQLKLAHIGEIDHWRRYGRSIMGQPIVEAYLRHTFPNADWSERDVRRMFVDAFMADIFSRDGKIPGVYEMTSAISERYLSAGMDGIVYPSVGHRGGLCVALHPRSAEQMGIVEFGLFQIEENLGYGLFKKRFVRDAASWDEDGVLRWKP